MAGLRRLGSGVGGILAFTLLILALTQLTAAECCYKVGRTDGDCLDGGISEQACLSRPGFTYDSAAIDCETLTDCQLGCCCDPQGSQAGTISLPFKCSAPINFYAWNDPRLPFRVPNPRDMYNYYAECPAFCASRAPPDPETRPAHKITGRIDACTQTEASRQCAPAENAWVYWPHHTQAGPQLYQTLSDASGRFEILGIPDGSRVTLYAELPGCAPYAAPSPLPPLAADTSLPSPIQLRCGVSAACTAPARPTAAWTPHFLPQVELSWTQPEACAAPHHYLVRRCFGHAPTGAATDLCWTLGQTTELHFADAHTSLLDLIATPPAGTQKLYYDIAIVVDGVPTWSEPAELDLVDAYCARGTRSEGQFCAPPAGSTPETKAQPHTCLAGQRTPLRKPDGSVLACGTTEECVRTADRRAICQAEDPCKKCNGLFGMFAWLGAPWDAACRQPACFFDASPTPADQHYACATGSCRGYRSRATCETNPCRFEGGCFWNPALADAAAAAETGLGTCQSRIADDPGNCAQCRAPSCTPSGCHGLGDCYFDRDDAARPCKSAAEMACLYYDTREDCIDSSHSTFPATDAGDAEFDVSWAVPAQAHPLGGSHARTKPSRDYFSFSTCAWVEYGNGATGCIKNADNRRPAPGTDPAGEDDCFSQSREPRNLACVGDNTPPVTAINLQDRQSYRLTDLINMEVLATDDHAATTQLSTFFCLMPEGPSTQPCYPNKSKSQLIADYQAGLREASPLAEGGSSAWRLRFFSRDLAQNYELPQERILTILTPTGVQITDVRFT